MALQQIADQVWLYPYDAAAEIPQPNVGVIITPSETVLVDAGNSPRHARQILYELNRQGAPPVKYVIYTHHHFDHSFGGQIWEGSVVVGAQQCRGLLLERYSGRHNEEQPQPTPPRDQGLRAMERAVGDWVGFKVVPPQLTFTEDLSLILDGISLSLRLVGGQHAADSITVLLQEPNLLFIGDCYYPPPQPNREDTDSHDQAMLEALLAQQASLYIEGHHAPQTHAEFARRLKDR
jgi:glyoxylase-like metal-dependent hydrolase (beta-lactamase superfamily II)